MLAASASEITTAARLLERGQLVALPTETVYGLGADAENPAAIARIYAAKRRPSSHPLIVHLAAGAELGYWVANAPAVAQALIDRFWPGPLTLILPRAAHIDGAVAGGQDSLGLRCPAHPVAQALLREFKHGKGGIAAPSANRFGRISPTSAQHVRDEFPGQIGTGLAIAAVLDGGECAVGIESTILDLSRWETRGAVLLRPGQIEPPQLAEVLGALPAAPDSAAPRVSGSLAAHYAPRTPVALVAPEDLLSLLGQLMRAGRRVALLHWHALPGTALRGISAYAMAPLAADYAQALYAGLRVLDAAGAEVMLIEAVPDSDHWQAVNDRLQRAAFDSAGALERLL